MDHAFPFFGAAAFLLGGLFLIFWPRTAWEMEEKPPADAPPPTPEALRKTRLIGVFLLVLGLFVLYFALFGEPARDPTLF